MECRSGNVALAGGLHADMAWTRVYGEDREGERGRGQRAGREEARGRAEQRICARLLPDLARARGSGGGHGHHGRRGLLTAKERRGEGEERHGAWYALATRPRRPAPWGRLGACKWGPVGGALHTSARAGREARRPEEGGGPAGPCWDKGGSWAAWAEGRKEGGRAAGLPCSGADGKKRGGPAREERKGWKRKRTGRVLAQTEEREKAFSIISDSLQNQNKLKLDKFSSKIFWETNQINLVRKIWLTHIYMG